MKMYLMIVLLLSAISFRALAQDEAAVPVEDNADLDQIEAEIGRVKEQKREAAPATSGSEETRSAEPQTLSDLGKLAPFSEVSVLQKRYQPKTERFQLSWGLGGIANDPWFQGLGGSLRFGYYFREAWGLELNGTFLSNSERDAAKDLYENNTVSTSSIVSTKGYTGLDLIWSPIYGKMSLYNTRIIPFDMFFGLGLGQSTVDGATSKTVPTLHLGAGQIFALSKSWGFRWDFAWNMFSAKQVSTSGVESTTQFNNLILMFGGSYFFPEVRTR